MGWARGSDLRCQRGQSCAFVHFRLVLAVRLTHNQKQTDRTQRLCVHQLPAALISHPRISTVETTNSRRTLLMWWNWDDWNSLSLCFCHNNNHYFVAGSSGSFICQSLLCIWSVFPQGWNYRGKRHLHNYGILFGVFLWYVQAIAYINEQEWTEDLALQNPKDHST